MWAQKWFSKKKIIPQTTFVPTFWPHIISELDGVWVYRNYCTVNLFCWNFAKEVLSTKKILKNVGEE